MKELILYWRQILFGNLYDGTVCTSLLKKKKLLG